MGTFNDPMLKPKPFHSEDLPATDFSRQQLGDVDVVINRVLSISSFGRRSEEEKELVRRARAEKRAPGAPGACDFCRFPGCWKMLDVYISGDFPVRYIVLNPSKPMENW